MGPQQHAAQRRRQGQRVDGRDQHRDRNGNGELPEELAGDAGHEGDRHEDREQHQGDRDDRRGDLGHRPLGGLPRGEVGMLLHHALDVLDDHDGVVDDDADGQHQGEERDGVRRVAHRLQGDEGPDQAHGHGERRDQRRAQAAEEQEHHDDDEHEGLDQGLADLVDRLGDEGRGIVGDLPGEPLGEGLGQGADPGLDLLQGREGVRAGGLVDRHHRGGAAVQPRLPVEIGGAELDPGDVAEPQHGPVRVRAQDDVAELLRGAQAPLRLDAELELLLVGDRAGADPTHGRLHVLRPDRRDDVARGQVEAGELVGPQPRPHRVILRPPQGRVADAGRALDAVEQIDRHVVRDEERVLHGFGRVDRQHAQQRGGLLLDRDALLADVLGQLGQGDLHPVVDVDGVDVRIGAELEGPGERVAAVVAADALHVDHLVDAHDLRLDGLCDRGFHHLGRGAGIGRRHRDLGRHDVGVLRHRDGEQRQRAGDRRDDGDDHREARPVDEDRREHGLRSCWPTGRSGSPARRSRAAPAAARRR